MDDRHVLRRRLVRPLHRPPAGALDDHVVVRCGRLVAPARRAGRAPGLPAWSVPADAGAPVVLADVAATAVLGTRFAVQDQRVLAAALLATAGRSGRLFVPPVLKNWRPLPSGSSSSSAWPPTAWRLLSAILSVSFRAAWLVGVAGLFLLLGLALLRRHRCSVRPAPAARRIRRPLDRGRSPGHRCPQRRQITQAAVVLGLVPGPCITSSRSAPWALVPRRGLVLPLIVAECVRPRLGYDVRRWATVFPFGMYPACSFTVGRSPASPPSSPSAGWAHGSGRRPAARARRADPSFPTPGGRRASARSFRRIPALDAPHLQKDTRRIRTPDQGCDRGTLEGIGVRGHRNRARRLRGRRDPRLPAVR